MKSYLVFVLIILLQACANRNVVKMPCTFKDIGTDIAEKERARLTVLQGRYMAWVNVETRSDMGYTLPEPLLNLSRLNEYTLTTIPLYKFDIKKFYAAPSPKKLLENIIPSRENYILAMDDSGHVKFLFSIKEENDVPVLDFYVDNENDVISWIPDSLSKAKTKDMKIFRCGNREFVTYMKSGKPVYHKITGELFSPEQLCEFFVNGYNCWLEDFKYMKENFPELLRERKKEEKEN